MSTKKILVSIVIPAYNEVKNFREGRLNDLFTFLKKQKFSWEILFVDDGSRDDTLSLLKQLISKHPNVQVLTIPHGGKAAAVKEGVMKAQGEFVVFTDFDQSTPISEILKTLKQFEQGADIVIAHRKRVHNWPLPMRIRSRIFNFLVQLIILPGITDTQCGFKAFRTPVAKKLFNALIVTKKSQQGRFMGAFDVELLFLAKKMKYTINSIDVDWYCVRAGNLAKSEPVKMLGNIIQIKLLDLLNKY